MVCTAPVITLAGSGAQGLADGAGTLAKFAFLRGVAISPDGAFALVADQYNFRVRRIAMESGVVTTLAGSFALESVDGSATAASFQYPTGVSVSPDASFALVTDLGSHRVRCIQISTGAVTTLAGSSQGYADGAGTAAMFDNAYDVAISPDASFALVADSSNHRVRRLTLATGMVTTLAGSTQGYADGAGTTAMFSFLTGVAISPDGSFALVADYGNHRVRRLTISTGVVATIAGSTQGFADGVGTVASFQFPNDIAISPDASFALVADMNNNCVRRIDIGSTVVATLIGLGQGYADGMGTSAQFDLPSSVAIAPDSTYALISDTNNHRVRRGLIASPCGAGFYCPAGSSSQTLCDAGYYCPSRSSSATQAACPLGSFCPNASTTGAPFPSPVGAFCPTTGMSASAPCPTGYFCAASGLSAVSGVCDYGAFCQSGASSAEGMLCPPGQHCVNDTSAACDRGSFCVGGMHVPPTLCPAGTFCAALGMSAPSKCDGGSFCAAVGLTAPSGQCGVGQVCPAGASAALACPAGMLCLSAGLSVAAPCAPGAACSATVQTACQPGAYALGGASACAQCPRGTFSASPGSNSQRPGLCAQGASNFAR